MCFFSKINFFLKRNLWKQKLIINGYVDFIIKYYNSISNRNKTNNNTSISKNYSSQNNDNSNRNYGKSDDKSNNTNIKISNKSIALAVKMMVNLTMILVENPTRNQGLSHLELTKIHQQYNLRKYNFFEPVVNKGTCGYKLQFTFNVNSTNLVSLLASWRMFMKTWLTKELAGLWKHKVERLPWFHNVRWRQLCFLEKF